MPWGSHLACGWTASGAYGACGLYLSPWIVSSRVVILHPGTAATSVGLTSTLGSISYVLMVTLFSRFLPWTMVIRLKISIFMGPTAVAVNLPSRNAKTAPRKPPPLRSMNMGSGGATLQRNLWLPGTMSTH